MYVYGMGGYGGGAVAGYSGGAAAGYGGGGYASWGIRWIYALLILIVIVLQFGRRRRDCNVVTNACEDGVVTVDKDCNESLIDNSVLFIIVVFLLILCAGCWWGGYGGSCGSYGGGYGY
jgi:hypothetical protein